MGYSVDQERALRIYASWPRNISDAGFTVDIIFTFSHDYILHA